VFIHLEFFENIESTAEYNRIEIMMIYIIGNKSIEKK